MSLWLYNSDEQTLTRYQLSGVTVRHTDFDYLGNDRDPGALVEPEEKFLTFNVSSLRAAVNDYASLGNNSRINTRTYGGLTSTGFRLVSCRS